jgi:hypothetical protein
VLPCAANRQDQREERKGARLTMKYLWCLYVTLFSLLVVEELERCVSCG